MAPAVLVLAVGAFFWKIATGRYVWFEGGEDIVYQVLPLLQMQAAALHSGQFPLWDPHQFGGEPVLGQIQPGLLNPLQYLVVIPGAITGHISVHWFLVYFVILHALAALAAYFLFRELGVSAPAAWLGGFFYAVASVGGNVGWPQVICGMIYPPLVVLFLWRSHRGARPLFHAALAGLFLGLAWLSGHHAVPMLLSVAVGVAGLALLKGRYAICLVVAGLVSAPQIWSALEFSRHSVRWIGVEQPIPGDARVPYAAHSIAVHPAELVNILWAGDLSPKNSFAGWLFVGVGGSALAALALARFRTDARVRLFAIGALGFLLFALGPFGGFYAAAYWLIPFLDKLREPVFALALFAFAMAGLIALGADRLMRGRRGWVVFALAFALLWLEQAQVSGHSPQTRLVPIGEAKLFGQLAGTADLAAWLRAHPGEGRIEVNRDDLGLNFGDWYGGEQLGGYEPAVFAPLFKLEWWRPEVRRLYGVTYYLARKPAEANQVELFAGASGLKIFENPGARPRTWVQPEGCGEARVAGRRLNSVTIRANLRCPGTVVLSDNNYPGWRAAVDGGAAPIRDVEGALRGVVVEAGPHVIELRYRPASFYGGCALFLAGLTVVAVLARRS